LSVSKKLTIAFSSICFLWLNDNLTKSTNKQQADNIVSSWNQAPLWPSQW